MRFIKLPEVEHMTGKKKSAIFKEMKLGTFPENVPQGGSGCAKAWVDDEIIAWMQERMDERKQPI